MLETLIFQCSIAIAHNFDNFTNISIRLWNLVYIWSLLLSLKFQANTYSFERVVMGTTFHPDTVYICIYTYCYRIHVDFMHYTTVLMLIDDPTKAIQVSVIAVMINAHT